MRQVGANIFSISFLAGSAASNIYGWDLVIKAGLTLDWCTADTADSTNADTLDGMFATAFGRN